MKSYVALIIVHQKQCTTFVLTFKNFWDSSDIIIILEHNTDYVVNLLYCNEILIQISSINYEKISGLMNTHRTFSTRDRFERELRSPHSGSL